MAEDNLQILYNNLVKEGYQLPDYNTFKGDMSDSVKSKKLHGNLVSEGYSLPDYDTFVGDMGLKKKSPSSIYLESLVQKTPASKALKDLWVEQDKPTEVQPPLKSPSKKPVKEEEIFAEKQDVSSILKAQQKLPDYLKGEQYRIVSEAEQSIVSEIGKLKDTYQSKIDTNPEQADELNKEFKQKQESLIDLRTANISVAVENLYKKGKTYKYLDQSDVKDLSGRAKEIASQPMDFFKKNEALQTLQSSVLSKVGDMSPEELSGLKREINDVVTQSALLDENGTPSVYGWKKEIMGKIGGTQRAIIAMEQANPNLVKIGSDYKIRTSEEGKKYGALIDANKLYKKILSLPDDGGSFWDGVKTQGKALATMGLGDMFEAIDVKQMMNKAEADGKISDEEQAFIDAYGIYQVTQSADEFSKAYKTGQNIAGSVAWMEQFALTSGLGTLGEKTASKLLGQRLKAKVTDSVLKGTAKTVGTNIVKGLGQAVVRTPVLTGGYTEAIKRTTPEATLTPEGTWNIDKSNVESTVEALSKGLYSNFANAFGETAGGWFAGSKANKLIGKSIGITKIPKGISKAFGVIGMQPMGELGEEYLTTLMETPVMGDQTLKEAFSGENMWDTAVTVGLMSGFFGGIQGAAAISESNKRASAMRMINLFGRDNVSALRTAIENNDKVAFANAIKSSFEGQTVDDLGMPLEKAQKELIKYANSLAQTKGYETAQEATKEASKEEVAPLISEEQITNDITNPAIEGLSGTQKQRIIVVPSGSGVEIKDPTMSGFTTITNADEANAVKSSAQDDMTRVNDEMARRDEAKKLNAPYRILSKPYNTKEEFLQGIRDTFGGKNFDAEVLLSDDVQFAEDTSLTEIMNLIDDVTPQTMGSTKDVDIELKSTGELQVLPPFYETRIKVADGVIKLGTKKDTEVPPKVQEEAPMGEVVPAQSQENLPIESTEKPVQENKVFTELEQTTNLEQEVISAQEVNNLSRGKKEGLVQNIQESGKKLLDIARKAEGWFADNLRRTANRYVFIPTDSYKNYGEESITYSFLPKPTDNTVVTKKYRYDLWQAQPELAEKYPEVIMYDKTIVDKDGNVIDPRYVPHTKDLENELTSDTFDPIHLYRGISSAELESIKKTGKIRSNARMNLGGQGETTSFAQFPVQALNYADGFTSWGDDVTFAQPNYVIKVKKEGVDYEPALKGQLKNEVNVKGDVPSSNIVDIWEIRRAIASPGNVEIVQNRGQISEGGRSPMSGLTVMRKLSTEEVNSILGTKESVSDNKVENLQEGSKEAISAPIEEKGTDVPPIVEEPPKVAEKFTKEPREREKAFYKRLRDSSVPSERLKEKIKENGLTYTVLSNEITKDNVDFVIAELGLEEAWKKIKDLNSSLDFATRSGLSERLVVHYDNLSKEAEKEGNLEDAEYYSLNALEVADWKDWFGREGGRFNQYSGSDESTRLLGARNIIRRTKRDVTKQRNKKIQDNKEDIKEKRDGLRDANKESVNDLIESKAYQDLKKRVEDLEKKIAEGKVAPPKPPKDLADKVKKEHAYRATQWDAFKKAGKGNLSASVVGLNAEQIEAIGNIVGSYVREGVYRTEDLIARLKKDWFKNTGKILDDNDAKALLPQKVDGKSLEDIETEGETEKLATNLTNRVKRLLEDPKIPKDNPIKQLLDTLFQKIQEKDTKEKPTKEKKPTIGVIEEAIKNREKYADVWEESKEKVIFMIDTNTDLTEDQQSDYKKRLASFFDEVIGKPYSETQVGKATKEKIKEEGIDIDKIVRQHYTVQDATGRSLADKLVDQANLTGEQAELLAKAIQKEFSKIATARKRSILLQGIKARAKSLANPKQAKLEWERLVELTNLGAFSNAEFSEAYADAWGFPKLTEEQSKEIEKLAQKIQERDGFKKDEAVRDYLNYIANLPGLDLGEVALGWWYASILSGERTQFKNFLGNLINTVFEVSIGTIYNTVVKGDFKTTQAMWTGLLSVNTLDQAMTEFRYTWSTGYSPVRNNKIESAQELERFKLKGGWFNPVNSAKYVGRFMSATDAFFYMGLKNMRAHELAMREARKQNAEATEPTVDDWAKATEILYGTNQRAMEAQLQAKDEGLKGLAYKKRVWEIMERSRGEGIITDSNNFASHGTYNYRPEGGLGMITEAIAHTVGDFQFRIKNPFNGKKSTVRFGKFFVPFTRIIANVGNTALDYTPVGFVRAGTGRVGTERKPSNYRKLTSEERARTLIKATIGTSTAMILWFLSEPPDDGSEPTIQITANGTGDYAKNQELKGSPNGWQQYSIKMGDKWYSYQYTPLFLILAPLGFVRDTEKYKKDKAATMSSLDMMGSGLSLFMSALSDMTALSTTSGLLEAISSGDLATAEKFWKRMASSTVKGFAYPKAVEQTKQMIDDFNDDPTRYSSSLVGKMIKDMPVIQNRFPVQYNALGEETSFDAIQMLEQSKGTPVSKYIADNEAFVGVPSQKDEFCIIYDSEKGIERGMNDKEYMKFIQVSGTEIKNRIISDLMPRTDLTPEDVRKELSNIKSEVRKQVKATLFGWLDVKQEHPSDWKKMVEMNAVPIPQELIEVQVDDKKVRLDEKQTDEFNKKAIEYYRSYVIPYLNDESVVKDDKSQVDEETGDNLFNLSIRQYWSDAKTDAKVDMEDKLMSKK
jgi:hypothetical protein